MFTSNKTVDQRKITDLEELATIEPPNRDDVSEIFKPVKHFDFVNTMIEGLKDRQGRPRKFVDDSTGDIIELEATGGSYIVSGSYFNKTEKKNYFRVLPQRYFFGSVRNIISKLLFLSSDVF